MTSRAEGRRGSLPQYFISFFPACFAALLLSALLWLLSELHPNSQTDNLDHRGTELTDKKTRRRERERETGMHASKAGGAYSGRAVHSRRR